jgi:hypothetical protein
LTNRQQAIEAFVANGYEEICTDSGTGSSILVNAKQQRVAKINQDAAYAKFADFCLGNPELAVPKIYSHEYPLGPFLPSSNDPYSVAVMELLTPLTEDEGAELIQWVHSVFEILKLDKSMSEYPSGAFNLTHTLQMLVDAARRVEVNLDVLKSTNYLKRVSGGSACIVFSDPFN